MRLFYEAWSDLFNSSAKADELRGNNSSAAADKLLRGDGDNPTIGIVLCSDTDEDIARYSILKGNEQLFATKYQLMLPSKEQLKEEIERQKMIFNLQKSDKPL